MNQLVKDKLKTYETDKFFIYPEYQLKALEVSIDILAITNKGIFVINTVDIKGSIAGNQEEDIWVASDFRSLNAEDVKFNNPSLENRRIIQYMSELLEAHGIKLPIIDLLIFNDEAMLMGIQTTSTKIQLRDLTYTMGKYSRVDISAEKLKEIYKLLKEGPTETILKVEKTSKEETEWNLKANVVEPVPKKGEAVAKHLEEKYRPVQQRRTIDRKINEELPLDRPIQETYISKSEAPGYEPMDLKKPYRKKTRQEQSPSSALKEFENERITKIIVLVIAFFVLSAFTGGFGSIILIVVERYLYKLKADNLQDWIKKVVGILLGLTFLLLFIKV